MSHYNCWSFCFCCVYIDKSIEYSTSGIIHGELTQNVIWKENIRQAIQLTLTFCVLLLNFRWCFLSSLSGKRWVWLHVVLKTQHKKISNKHPLAHWQEMIVVEFQFHPLEESLSGIHCNYVLWLGESRDASFVRTSRLIVRILVMTPSCMSRTIGSTHEMKMGRKVWFYCRSQSVWGCVEYNLEERASLHVRALRSLGRGGQTNHHPEISFSFSAARETHSNHSQSSQTWEIDGGLDLVNVDLKDYFSVSAAKAEPSQASLAQIKSWANRFAKIMFSSLTFTE